MSDAQVDEAIKTPPAQIREPEVTLKHLEALKRELLEELGKTAANDAQEKQELRNQVKELNDYIADLKTAEAKRDEVKGSSTTLVLPPADIPPQQPNVSTNQPPSGGETAHVPWWKKAW